MFDGHILRDIHKVTIADNEPVALHTTSRATPKDLLIAVQWSEVCNNFLKDKCRDTGARFIDNDQNFLFRDGSCDTSAFQNDSVRLSTCGVKRLMSNVSLAASKHREDGAQRSSTGNLFAEGLHYVKTD